MSLTDKFHSSDINIKGPLLDTNILSQEALQFVAALHREFGEERERLLSVREDWQQKYDNGELPSYPSETAELRNAEWKVTEIPPDLQTRHVEITGPVSRKIVINGLNSGADVFMADFEDSNSPTWQNCIEGQVNLYDAVRRTIDLQTEKKHYSLHDETATLMVRPRGWHLLEKHVEIDNKPVSAALFDFGLYFFHNARELIDRDSGPYFYLPKLEHYPEARLWNDVFKYSQHYLSLPEGSVRATVLLETLPATFEMEEILYELKDHSAGLNCGRWDYIFSFIKTFQNNSNFVLPDRDQVSMQAPFMDAYVKKVVQTCHRRGIHAMGGMAAQIPIKNDTAANEAAMEKVRKDKRREYAAGHDGTWVAHPGLVSIALDEFQHIDAPHQISNHGFEGYISEKDLIQMPTGTITEEGLQKNISVAIQYMAAWLGGNGCVPLYNLMEDAATAEISRTQVWQWLRHGAELADGRQVDRQLVENTLRGVGVELGSEYHLATKMLGGMVLQEELEPFLTVPAYDVLIKPSK